MSEPTTRTARKATKLLLVSVAVCIQPALAVGQSRGETKIILNEHLGLAWTDEVVTYPFSAEKGRCVAASVKVSGPHGPQACQLSEVVLWPGTKFVKSARLSFVIAKLEPQTTQTYTVSFSPTPAVGQFGMDLEYYVASPAGTPRHTVRYGLKPSAADVPRFSEYQDLLQLTLPGDGSYYVAMFPRRPDEKVPTFATSGDGRVITIRGEWGTDYAFLSKDPATAKVADCSFQGTAASIQNRRSGLVLALGEQGTVTAKSFALTAPFGASLHVGSAALTIDMPADHPAGEIVVAAPGAWKLRDARGVTLTKQPDGRHKLAIPAGKTAVQLVKAD